MLTLVNFRGVTNSSKSNMCGNCETLAIGGARGYYSDNELSKGLDSLEKRKFLMATYTNATAMTAVLEVLKNADGIDSELLEKFEHMTEQANKAKTSNYADSAVAREVNKRMIAVCKWLANREEPATNREIGEAVPGFTNPEGGVSSQRVTRACSKAIGLGFVEKGEKRKGYTTYLATNEGRTKFAE